MIRSRLHNQEVALARISRIFKLESHRHFVHEPVDCGYRVFTEGGSTYLQLDTYGSSGRQIPGKTSQSLQLDGSVAAQLKRLIEETFPGA